MSSYTITIAADDPSRATTTLKVEVSDTAPRITELVVRAGQGDGLTAGQIPALDLDLLLRAIAPAAAGRQAIATPPIAVSDEVPAAGGVSVDDGDPPPIQRRSRPPPLQRLPTSRLPVTLWTLVRLTSWCPSRRHRRPRQARRRRPTGRRALARPAAERASRGPQRAPRPRLRRRRPQSRPPRAGPPQARDGCTGAHRPISKRSTSKPGVWLQSPTTTTCPGTLPRGGSARCVAGKPGQFLSRGTWYREWANRGVASRRGINPDGGGRRRAATSCRSVVSGAGGRYW